MFGSDTGSWLECGWVIDVDNGTSATERYVNAYIYSSYLNWNGNRNNVILQTTFYIYCK